MEDVDEILFIPEGSIPTIGWNNKEVDDREGGRMAGSSQKGTMKNMAEPGSIDSFQYFKIKDNEGTDGLIG
jgi:hypothetical protein